MLVLIALACRPADDQKVITPSDSELPAFDAPWEGLSPTLQATGSFDVALDEDRPGPAWFHTGDKALWGAEGSWLERTEPEGASQPVVVLTLAGRQADGFLTLQFQVASSAWVAGTVDLDGGAATGALMRHGPDSGSDVLAYVVGGQLELTQAGDLAKGGFTDIQLAEVGP